jgi:hypothetical protein
MRGTQIHTSCGLLVRLALMMAEGEESSKEADELRDCYAISEDALEPDERLLLKKLSAELYMLEDDEILVGEELEPSQLSSLEGAYREKRWPELLVLLSRPAGWIPDWGRAYLRARAYEGMELLPAAYAFYLVAQRLQNSPFMAYKAQDLLARWLPEHALRSSIELARGGSHAILTIQAANHLLLAFFENRLKASREEWLEIAAATQVAIALSSKDPDIPQEVVVSGYTSLAAALEVLRDYSAAATVLRVALDGTPDGPEKLDVKGHVMYLEHQVRSGQSVSSGIVLDAEWSQTSVPNLATVTSVVDVVDRDLWRILAV